MNKMTTEIPDDYKREENGIIKLCYEEESAVWLRVNPGLLPWPNDIAWVDSPVTRNDPWPGDLCGVDERGDLIIIEGKRTQTSDPFIDFVEFYQRHHQVNLSKTIRDRWQETYCLMLATII